RSFAKKLVDAKPGELRAVIVDLRNHGESHGADLAPPHTVEACADDVTELIAELTDASVRPPSAVEARSGRSRVTVVGHSYGGKVALQLARAHPDVVDEVW